MRLLILSMPIIAFVAIFSVKAQRSIAYSGADLELTVPASPQATEIFNQQIGRHQKWQRLNDSHRNWPNGGQLALTHELLSARAVISSKISR